MELAQGPLLCMKAEEMTLPPSSSGKCYRRFVVIYLPQKKEELVGRWYILLSHSNLQVLPPVTVEIIISLVFPNLGRARTISG